jgi:hypothetical protein
LRNRLQQQRLLGRQNPLGDAAAVVGAISHAIAAGDEVPGDDEGGGIEGTEFQTPKNFRGAVGAVWKLLKVYVDDDGTTWGAYMPKDEAMIVDEEDLEHCTKEDLELSYDVDIAEMSKIKAWIKASKDLSVAATASIGQRQSSRRTNPIERLE